MDPVILRYRSRDIRAEDLDFLKVVIARLYHRGRSEISRAICEDWAWVQPNGRFKEYAARDLLLRLEEKGLIELPARLRPKNNGKHDDFLYVPPGFFPIPLEGPLSRYGELSLKTVTPAESYLWDYLLHHYHYLGRPTLVGEHVRHIAYLCGHVVACLGWASAAFKVSSRDRFIGWTAPVRHKRLLFIANNVRFLIPGWVRVPHLASKVLALSVRRISRDWQAAYGHPLYLAETFVDEDRFRGTSYRASNWILVGRTRGHAKKGNGYHYHGRPKAIYLYPLRRNFRKLLDDEG